MVIAFLFEIYNTNGFKSEILLIANAQSINLLIIRAWYSKNCAKIIDNLEAKTNSKS